MRPKGFEQKNEKGFTLIELLVALAVSGVVMTAVYAMYQSQNKAYLFEEQMGMMQQNLRAVLFYMERDLRLVGCNPSKIQGSQAPGFTTANAASAQFTLDISGGEADGVDNDSDGLLDAADTDEDRYSDGKTDDAGEDIAYTLAGTSLMRNDVNSGVNEMVAENIEAIDFVYMDASFAVLNSAGTNVTAANLPAVRIVEITLVARTARPDPGFSNNTVYYNGQGQSVFVSPNDGYHRKALTTSINCRNMGL